MHNNGHGNGKRWLLIGLLFLGGFWLINDAYDDGFRDGIIQSGQTSQIRRYHGGPDFPWGLVILGGIGYIAWRKGAFDRFGGPGGPFNGGNGNGERAMQQYRAGNGPAQTPGSPPSQGFGSGFRGPRAFFEEWHRQAHEAASRAQYAVPPAPPAPPASASGNVTPQGGVAPTPPPTPPAPEYWASMGGTAETASNPGAPAAPDARQDDPRGTNGTQL